MTAKTNGPELRRMSVLGLGTMGGRCATVTAAAGHDTVGFDPSGAARDEAEAQGLRVTTTAEEALERAEIVLLSVPRPEHVRTLAENELRGAPRGSVVVDLSTIDPATARHAERVLAEHDVTYLDCPVLGRPAGCGSWTLVAGGNAEALEQVTPTLEHTIANRVLRVGDVGSGSVVKILNNLMFGAINAVTAEALSLCHRSGIDMGVFVDAVVDSGAATVSNLFRDIGPRMATGDDEPVFALELLAKDNLLARTLADDCGGFAPVTDAVLGVNARALDLGYGKQDSAAVLHGYRGDEEA